jgi:hypothetical protein
MTLNKFIVFAGLLLFISCQDFKNPEDIPAYIYVPDIEVFTTQAQGSNSHKVTEVYFYLEEEFLGSFSPGNTFPVLADGNSNLTFFAGIRENAIEDIPALYPLYERYELTKNLQPGVVETIVPRFEYAANCNFTFVEDFEGNHIFSELIDGSPDARLQIERNDVFEGQGSGRIDLTEEAPGIAIATSQIFENLPRNGAAVYLEMNYRTDVPLFIGLIGYDNINPPEEYYKLILNSNTTWNKVYIRLTEEIVALRRSGYRIVLRAEYNSLNSKEVQSVYIDNLKLIHL